MFWTSKIRQPVDDLESQPPSEFVSHALCDLFRRSSQSDRAYIRRRVDSSRDRWERPDLRTLASGEAHDLPPVDRVRDALTWQAIEGGRFDLRDNLMSIALIYLAAVRLELDVVAIFDDISRTAPPELASAITRFPRRAPSDRSAEAFGYREVPTAAGVRYESTDR